MHLFFLLISLWLGPPTNACRCAEAGLADATTMTVTLTGGANAGSYTANSPEATCSRGLTGSNSFGNQYSARNKSDKELSSLQLIVDDYDAARRGTDQFYVKIAFGKVLMGNKYEINGSTNSMAGPKQGKGRLTLTESGGKKTVVIEGETKDGVKVKATLTCFKTMTMKNGQLVEQ
jgi:hypothetical protein